MRTQIVKSQLTDRGVEVEWSDGVMMYFEPEHSENHPKCVNLPIGCRLMRKDLKKREIVSRTSARETLRGCGVQKMNK